MRTLTLLLGFLAVLPLGGCGKGPVVVHGTVSVGGQTPDSGEIRFIPVDGTTGPVNAGAIIAGKYEIKGRGGVPRGTYRVEIVAKKKTGRKVPDNNGFEMVMVDEQIQISPPQYAGKGSPLKEEVDGGSGEISFELPAK